MIDERRLLETLRAFIRAPSPQDDLRRVRAFVAGEVLPRLPQRAFDRVAIDPDGNLVAVKRGRGADKPFLLCAYGATFPAAGMAGAFDAVEVDGAPFDVEGPAIQGRGVSEQVAALAAAVEAVSAVVERHGVFERGLIFTTTIAGEMGSHEVVEAMSARGDLDARGGVLAAGTGNAICLGNLGRIDVHLEVRGQSCHSSDPGRGRNAIEGACQILERLRGLPLGQDPDLGRATLTPTHFETWPKAMHTVPDLARLILDRRLVPGEEVEATVAALAEVARLDGFTVEVAAGKFNYPNKVSLETEAAAATRQALLAVSGTAPVVYWRAALDAGYLTRRGIPSIIFGPGDMRFAHTDHEIVGLGQVSQAAQVYVRTLEQLCLLP